MGLEDNVRRDCTYLSIVAGKVAQRVNQHIEEGGKVITVERETKDQNDQPMTVIERQYTGIGGLLQKAEIKAGKFGHQLIFELIDDGQLYHLSVQMDSSYGRGILYKIPNIDPSSPVTFRPYNFINKEDDKMVGVTVIQEGFNHPDDKVPPKWTRDNPGDLPELVITEGFDNKKNYDGTARMKFLAETFLAWAKNIGAVNPEPLSLETEHAEKVASQPEPVAPPVDDAPAEDDDLPF